jgi:hypothetical protein
LADYIAALDEEHFRRSLVFLRRAFGGFSAREKRQMRRTWPSTGASPADVASEAIEKELTRDGREDAEGL